MNYILLFTSVIIDTLKNMYFNHFGKKILKTNKDNIMFNVVLGVGAVLFFAIIALILGDSLIVSGFTFIVAIFFALVTALAQYTSLMAISTGPMSYSVLFTYLGMIIPTVYGMICFHTPPTVIQIIGVVLMLITFYLCADLKKDSAITKKWFFFAFSSFVLFGLVGVCQVVHQSSPYADEMTGLLFWTFVFMSVFLLILYFIMPNKDNAENGYKIISKPSLIVLLIGVVVAAVNIINLYLSGHMESIIFFPIVNGGVIILSGLAAITIFKEKLDTKKLLGLIIGLISTILLSI